MAAPFLHQTAPGKTQQRPEPRNPSTRSTPQKPLARQRVRDVDMTRAAGNATMTDFDDLESMWTRAVRGDDGGPAGWG
jgi:hypothetical protein